MFATSAARLAGLAAVLLGWRPGDFWAATPAELAGCLHPLAPPPAAVADRATISQLKERFPDG